MAITPTDPSVDDPVGGDHLDPYRLPRHVRPVRYDVVLRPDLGAATFDGRVEIDVELTTPTTTIVLNAIDLAIGACEVDGTAATWSLDETTERLFVTPTHPVADATATITITFAGVLNDKLRGFYRSTYVDASGREQVIATTQMQSTDCRRVFPCWDEPDFKAVFGITLDVADGLAAVSNGREVARSTVDGRTVIHFADTMVMSSYLVAFVVGRLEMSEPVDVDGVPMRIVHVPGKAHLTAFGLEVGAFALRWFQDYYGIDYPGDKVDMLALPDFAAGAMENLGCITFRETALLVDPGTATQFELQNVADTVAHEIAHMWFGDLVTMRWWNGIWLNEAFATFMEVACCDAFRPDWERWTAFGLERTRAFEVDALASTRPVEYEVRSPDDCVGMFDVLTYQKGGALLRMLEQYLGAERFRDGVNQYLRRHSYDNTETGDLWDALETSTGEPARRLMDSWIWQPGHPIVSASLTRNEGREALALEQARFVFAATTTDDTLWAVPIRIRNGGEEFTVLLEDAGPLVVPLADPHGPVVVNAGGHGFYRVAYDSELRDRLAASLDGLDTLERYHLVDDARSASIAGRLAAVDLLDFLERFTDERDLAVWQSITTALRGLSRVLDGAPLEAFRHRVNDLVAPALAALGEPVDGESDLTGTLRGLLFSTAGVLGQDRAVQARARELYARATSDPDGVHPELVAAATAIVAATGGSDEYDSMLDGFRNGRTSQDQLRHLYAMAAFDDEELLLRTCEFAMSDEVRTQNAPFLLRHAVGNRRHGALAWAFVRDHWDEVNERFPASTIVRMISSIPLLTEPALVDEVQSFFAEHPIEQSLTTMHQLLERQLINAAYRARNEEALAAAVTDSR